MVVRRAALALRTTVVQISGVVLVVVTVSVLPPSDLPLRWFGSTSAASFVVVVTGLWCLPFSLRRSKLSRDFPTSRRRRLARRRLQVRKGHVVVLHPVLWVVDGGSVSCRILAVLLRVGRLGFF